MTLSGEEESQSSFGGAEQTRRAATQHRQGKRSPRALPAGPVATPSSRDLRVRASVSSSYGCTSRSATPPQSPSSSRRGAMLEEVVVVGIEDGDLTVVCTRERKRGGERKAGVLPPHPSLRTQLQELLEQLQCRSTALSPFRDSVTGAAGERA
jgi:hypothetical protein